MSKGLATFRLDSTWFFLDFVIFNVHMKNIIRISDVRVSFGSEHQTILGASSLCRNRFALNTVPVS